MLQATSAVANELGRVCDEDSRSRARVLTHFDAEAVPNISLATYLERLRSLSKAAPATLVATHILIQRVTHQALPLTWYNVYRVALGCFVVAAKTSEDLAFRNKHYASLGGVTVSDMGRLERYVLRQLDWNTFISRETFEAAVDSLACVVGNLRVRPQVCMEEMASVGASSDPGSIKESSLDVLSQPSGWSSGAVSPVTSVGGSDSVFPSGGGGGGVQVQVYAQYSDTGCYDSLIAQKAAYGVGMGCVPVQTAQPARMSHDPYSF